MSHVRFALCVLTLWMGMTLALPTLHAEESDLWEVALYLGPTSPSAPYDFGQGTVVYTIPAAPPSIAVRGNWPGSVTFTLASTGQTSAMPLVVGNGLSTVSLPAGFAGQKVIASYPWNVPVVQGAAPTDYSVGGYFWNSVEGVAYTLTWPDNCGAVWPCPADDYVRVKWDVYPAAGTTGFMLAEDSRGTYTDPFHVSWAWFVSAVRSTTAKGYTVVGRSSVADELADMLDARDPYIDTINALLGDRPYAAYGFVDTGNWGAVGSVGGMEHSPFAFVDSADSLNYPTLADHEYVHAWFSGHVGYPHVGEMIVGEGTATYIETVARDLLDGTGDDEIKSYCLYVAKAARKTPHAAWEPDGADIPPADLFGPALPYYAGALQLFDISLHELGSHEALAPVLGDVARALPPGAYSWSDILKAIEDEVGIDTAPYMGWVLTPKGASRLAARCDLF